MIDILRRVLVITIILGLIISGTSCSNQPTPKPTPTPAPPLDAPKLLSPHNGATGIQLRPTLIWEPASSAGGYELRVSPNRDFSDIIHSVSLRLTSYQPSDDLVPSTWYYWMVAAKMNPADANTPIAWSEVWTFNTAARPTPTPAPTPGSTEEPNWFPDPSKIVVSSRLALEEGVIISIPPNDMRIVPFEIKQGERIRTFSITATSGGGFQSFFRNSKGKFVLESPLMPWPPDTYYLYVRNESQSADYCKVRLLLRITTQL